jgi:hypothetical protein
MSKRGLMAAIAAALATTVALTGCQKTIEKDSAESEISNKLQGLVGEKPKSVSCPDDIEAKAGERFDCDVEYSEGTKSTVTGTATNDDGNFEFVPNPPLPGAGGRVPEGVPTAPEDIPTGPGEIPTAPEDIPTE